jgi:hypothetical protein
MALFSSMVAMPRIKTANYNQASQWIWQTLQRSAISLATTRAYSFPKRPKILSPLLIHLKRYVARAGLQDAAT